jgi:predicted RecB family nuclease
MTLLTKSKYMNGLQCTRLLWFANKKQLPELTLSDEHKFSQGHDFEEYVKQLYPKGIDLAGMGFKENIYKTEELVKKNKTIFEAGFAVDNLYVRTDLIKPSKNGWDLYEIKSTTKTKPQHMLDLAFQKYVLEKCGLKINKCFVIFINNEYIKNGNIDLKELILQEEVTEQVDLVDDIEKHAKAFIEVISQKSYTDIPISQDCNKPYECPLKKNCWGTLPEYNVLQLTNWRVYWKLLEEGIEDIKDIPEGTKLTAKDEIIIEAVKENKPIISKEHIKHFLKSLNYPLYHFDFETFDTAVPIYDKSRPYQKIPFQYSLHIEQEDGSIEHREFLAEGDKDPRLLLLNQMKTDLKRTGDIIVFNKSFEISVMNKLAEDFPEHKWLLQAINRIVDLADPFKAFYYYNPSQKGSYSLKKVLPAIAGKSYDELEINNGGDASMMHFYSQVKPKLNNKEEIRKNLLEYCGLDTKAMVDILKELNKLLK